MNQEKEQDKNPAVSWQMREDAFLFTFYGPLLDQYPEASGYRLIFLSLAGLGVLGLICSRLLVHRLNLTGWLSAGNRHVLSNLRGVASFRFVSRLFSPV